MHLYYPWPSIVTMFGQDPLHTLQLLQALEYWPLSSLLWSARLTALVSLGKKFRFPLRIGIVLKTSHVCSNPETYPQTVNCLNKETLSCLVSGVQWVCLGKKRHLEKWIPHTSKKPTTTNLQANTSREKHMLDAQILPFLFCCIKLFVEPILSHVFFWGGYFHHHHHQQILNHHPPRCQRRSLCFGNRLDDTTLSRSEAAEILAVSWPQNFWWNLGEFHPPWRVHGRVAVFCCSKKPSFVHEYEWLISLEKIYLLKHGVFFHWHVSFQAEKTPC